MKNLAPAQLEDYGVFDDDVIDRVEEAADRLRSYRTHDEVFEDLGVETFTTTYQGYNPSDIVRIGARGSDRKGVIPVGFGIANPTDAGQILQLAGLALTEPDYDFVALGNPSGGSRFDGGVLGWEQIKLVAGGNLSPVVDPYVRYLDHHGYDKVLPYGYSFGAEISAWLGKSEHLPIMGHIAIESAAAKGEFPLLKGGRFMTTGGPFSGYVQDSKMPAFKTARKESLGSWEFNSGVAKLSNLACALYVAKGNHEEVVADLLRAHPGAVHTGFWGAASEFGNDKQMPSLYERLVAEFGERAVGLALAGQKHAVANHMPTQMAVIAQGVKNAEAGILPMAA